MEGSEIPADSAELRECDRLWTVDQVAQYLQKSPRWVFYQLRLPDDKAGSVPHTKLGRSPRFIPDDVKQWVAMGCPPVSDFKNWKADELKKRKRAG